MSKYLIEFIRFDATLLMEFDSIGRITSLTANYGKMDKETADFLVKRIPREAHHIETVKNFPNVKVTEVPYDTTFQTFWNNYANKFGNKSRSNKLWEALKNPERIKAMEYIQTYNQWLLKNAGVQKKLPETYLNQQPWNN